MATGSKDKILERARDLFYQRGYMATSVDEIIAEAKVSKSNFYYHFKSKEDLGIAVLEQRAEEFLSFRSDTLCNADLCPRERLHKFLYTLAELQETQWTGGCPFGNLVAEMSEHSERFRCYLSSMFAGLNSVIEGTVDDAQRLCEFRRDIRADQVAGLIVQMIQGAQLMVKCHKAHDPLRQSANLLFYLLDAGDSRRSGNINA